MSYLNDSFVYNLKKNPKDEVNYLKYFPCSKAHLTFLRYHRMISKVLEWNFKFNI